MIVIHAFCWVDTILAVVVVVVEVVLKGEGRCWDFLFYFRSSKKVR